MTRHHHSAGVSWPKRGVLEMKTELDYEDPMDWVYEVRRRILEKYGHDVRRMAAAATDRMKRDEANGIRYVRLPIVHGTPVGT